MHNFGFEYQYKERWKANIHSFQAWYRIVGWQINFTVSQSSPAETQYKTDLQLLILIFTIECFLHSGPAPAHALCIEAMKYSKSDGMHLKIYFEMILINY